MLRRPNDGAAGQTRWQRRSDRGRRCARPVARWWWCILRAGAKQKPVDNGPPTVIGVTTAPNTGSTGNTGNAGSTGSNPTGPTAQPTEVKPPEPPVKPPEPTSVPVKAGQADRGNRGHNRSARCADRSSTASEFGPTPTRIPEPAAGKQLRITMPGFLGNEDQAEGESQRRRKAELSTFGGRANGRSHLYAQGR